MANKTIGDLTAAGTVVGTELLEVEQSGNSRKIAADTLLARVVAVLDATLGSTAWRTAAPVTSVAGLTGVVSAAGLRTAINVADGADVSPVASVAGLTGTVSAAGLRSAINVEDGATADQNAAEIAALIAASSAAQATLRGALADPAAEVSTDITLGSSHAGQWIDLTGSTKQTITINADSWSADDYASFVITNANGCDIVAGTGTPTLVNCTGGTLTAIPQYGAFAIKAGTTAGTYYIVGVGG